MTETWVYQDEQSVKISGDVTNKYYPNHIARFTQGGNTKFFVITTVFYDSGYTYMYLAGGGIYTVEDAAISDHFVSVYGAPTNPAMDFGFAFNATFRNLFYFEIPYDMQDTAPATNSTYEIKYVGGRFNTSMVGGQSGIYFECEMFLSSETEDTIYAQLVNLANSTVITGSEISAVVDQWQHVAVRSGDLYTALPYGPTSYAINAKSLNGGTYQIVRPRILVRFGPPYVPLS